ncbi:MAG TPA: class II aldolase/adducin family protein [Usitatibacter sp.]|nr:class II aldolase/adducin family protein [Usitatibacter sp.]
MREPQHERGLRLRLVAVARRLVSLGISPATSGNVSARVPGGFIVTPSGIAYASLHPDDLVFLGPGGERGGGQREPSTEWRMHRDIYAAFPQAGGVVHVHSPFATTLACLRRPIPAFHYEVALAGGMDIPCAGYATFGTQELSDLAMAALADRRACLLANHGALVWGEDLEAAAMLAERVEFLARVYWQALQIGEPELLNAAEMDHAGAKFERYGKQ